MAANAATDNPARELVNKYCVSCHNEKLKTGGPRAGSNRRRQSLQLARDLGKGDREAAQPCDAAARSFRALITPPTTRLPAYLESEIDRAAAAHVNPGRSASLHRLNRAEYANAVRDLIAVDVDAQAMLPPDEQAFGFENNAEALSMQPALLDRYVSAASAIARRAVGDSTIPPAFVRYGALKDNANDQTYLRQVDRLGEDFPLGSKGGVAARHYFPVDGEYVFKLRLQRAWDSDNPRPERARLNLKSAWMESAFGKPRWAEENRRSKNASYSTATRRCKCAYR